MRPREHALTDHQIAVSADADEATVKATATALAEFARHTIESLGASNASEARGKLGAAVEALATNATLAADNARMRADGIKRDLRATLEICHSWCLSGQGMPKMLCFERFAHRSHH